MEVLLISNGILRRSLLRGGRWTALWITTAMASPAEQPSAVVAFVAAQGLAAADPRVPQQQRFAQLRSLFDQYFDIGHVAAIVLGRYRLLRNTAGTAAIRRPLRHLHGARLRQ